MTLEAGHLNGSRSRKARARRRRTGRGGAGTALRLFRTTAFKLSLFYFAVFAVLALFLIGYIAQTTTRLLTEQMQETIEAEIKGLAEQYRIGGIRRLARTVELRAKRPGASLYLVTDFQGRPIAGNVAELPSGVFEAGTEGAFQVSYTRLADAAATPQHAVIRVFSLPGGFTLLVGRDVGEREAFARVVRRALAFTAAALVGLGVLTWLFVSRYVSRRMESVSRTSRRIMDGDLSRRLEVTGSGDEFDRLAHNLNAMLERIERLMTGLKDVSDNIAHDLKTPLTRLRNRAETALHEAVGEEGYRASLEATIEDADQMIRTFNALLMIARSEAGSSDAAFTRIDPAEIAGDVVELYEPLAEEAGVEFRTDFAAGLRLRGNRELIGQALANLVDNALKYATVNNPAPCVDLVVRGSEEAVLCEVHDNGPGIPEEERHRVTERFFRLDESRSLPGAGLGLSLVSAVASLHGGTLTLEEAREGGVKAILSLPVEGASS